MCKRRIESSDFNKSVEFMLFTTATIQLETAQLISNLMMSLISCVPCQKNHVSFSKRKLYLEWIHNLLNLKSG